MSKINEISKSHPKPEKCISSCIRIGVALILVIGMAFASFKIYKWVNAPTSSISRLFLDELPQYLATAGKELDSVNWHDFRQWVHNQGQSVPAHVHNARFNYEVKRQSADGVNEAAGRGEWKVRYKFATPKDAVHTEKTAEKVLNERIRMIQNAE